MISLHQVINPLQQILWKGSVEANSFAQVRCHVEINYSPHPTGIVRITHMDIYFLRLGKRVTISD